MYTIVYFSPTGNVLHLAERLAGLLGVDESEILPLEFTEPGNLKKNEQLVILFPVHAFNAPRTVKRFVKQLPSNLYKGVNLIAVGSSVSWLNEAVSSDLKKVLLKKEYKIIVDEIVAMPLTIIISFSDKLSHKLVAEAEEKIKDISVSIIEREKSVRKVKVKSHIANSLGKGESPAAKLFGRELHANSKCTSCGICWDNCPERNIKQGSDGRPKFGSSCLMCMRCIYNCPEHAISPRFSKFIPIKKGYSFKALMSSDEARDDARDEAGT